MEMRLVKSSSFVVVVSKNEATTLKNEVSSVNPVIIPNIHFPEMQKNNLPRFEERKDLLFVGGFQHTPNVDAALFLTKEIFPLLKKEISNIKLLIVGSKPPDCVKALASDDVVVTGYVPDITPYMENSKLMVAPLRYGAGVKGKITQSMSFGLPVVTTAIGAEGLNAIDGESILVANSAQEFASKVIQIYTNKELWNRISANSYELALKRYSPENILEMLRILFSS
jgi:glycosyltransferase involved in cell wall biosynthesis